MARVAGATAPMSIDEGQARDGAPLRGALATPGAGEPLPPIVAAALEEAGLSLLARLDRIAAHSPSSERYTILGEIGRGAMGSVRRVWDNDLQRELAMKEIPARRPERTDEEACADHERRLARFIDEARITSQLDHPGIVPVHEIAVDAAGRLFFTMPLVRGRNLEEVLECVRTGRDGWSRPRALHVLLNVCRTVAFAHSRGIVHRDLKPANVMVGPYGEAYVMDWGLALVLGRREQRRVVGTPAYMSPEQAEARAEDVGPRSDVFSLGAILYQMLTGRMPHALSVEQSGGNFEGVIGSVPRPVAGVVPGVPGELSAICAKAMARDPADRYGSALAMAEDLRAFLEDRVVGAFDSRRVTRFRKWRRRNPNLWRAIEASILLGLASGALLLYQHWSNLREAQAHQAALIRTSYIKNIRATASLLQQGATADARESLPDYDSGLCGWEWNHLRLALDSSESSLIPHAGADLKDILHTPDGAAFLTVAADRTMALWDAATEERIATFAGHESEITCAAIDPRGRYVASGDEDNRMILWELGTAAIHQQWGERQANVRSVCFAADGSRIAWSDERGIDVRGLPDGTLFAHAPTPPGEEAVGLVFGVDPGQLIAVHGDNSIRRWEIRAGVANEKARGGIVLGPKTPLAAHRERSLLAVGGQRQQFQLLDLVSLAPRGSPLEAVGMPTALAFDARGDRLAVGTNNGVLETWDVASRRLVCRQHGHRTAMTGLAFHPEGERILTSSADGTVRAWSPGGGAELLVQGPDDRILGHPISLAFSADGATLSGSSMAPNRPEPELRTWDTRTGRVVRRLTTGGTVSTIAFHPTDGSFAYTTQEDPVPRPSAILLRDAGASADRLVLRGHAGFVRSIAFDSAGERLLSRDDVGGIRLWAVADGRELLVIEDVDSNNHAIALHAGGKRFANDSIGGQVEIRDCEDGAIVRTLKWTEDIRSLAFHPTRNELAAATAQGTIVRWSLDRDDPPRTIQDPLPPITAFAYDPAGTRIVTGSHTGRVRLWELTQGELLLSLGGPTNQVVAISFSPPGGDRIAAAALDGSVHIWRTAAAGGAGRGE
ncbi:MAG: serine/threonine-protein kinase [Planctomycetota bacterium]